MIHLASSSPRRRALLKKARIRFKTVRPSYGEKREASHSPVTLTRGHALGKALSVVPRVRDGLVLGADTVVFCRGRVIGKPRDKKNAEKILRSLQGRWHTVVTAVALLRVRKGKVVKKNVFVEKTAVRLKRMDLPDIRRYLRRIRPLDKAGAYAVQAAGAGAVERVRGSFTNVVGLPMEKLKKSLGVLR